MEIQKWCSLLLETNAIWRSSINIVILSRKVSYEEGSKFAKDNGLVFMEVSAKTAYQVEDAFKKNSENLLEKIEKGVIDIKKDVPIFHILEPWNQSWQCP